MGWILMPELDLSISWRRTNVIVFYPDCLRNEQRFGFKLCNLTRLHHWLLHAGIVFADLPMKTVIPLLICARMTSQLECGGQRVSSFTRGRSLDLYIADRLRDAANSLRWFQSGRLLTCSNCLHFSLWRSSNTNLLARPSGIKPWFHVNTSAH